MGRMSPLWFLAVLLLVRCVVPYSLFAQSNPQRVTAIRLSDVDEDFAWQGEFVGYTGEHCGAMPWGMQVVALGDGKFSASLFQGGLPGQGGSQRTRLVLEGRRKRDLLIMEARGRHFEIHRSEVRVFQQNGRYLGRLTRVARTSPTMGASPPPSAQVLFRSASENAFPRSKLTDEGWLLSGVTTPSPVEDFVLHLEFQTPYMPYARGQARANSGVYIQRRYEVQILDSFGLEPEANGCGGLYRLQPPDVNMSFPPLTWQTYDIHFRAARFNAAEVKVTPAQLTVYHNGVPIHYQRPIPTKTGAGQPEGPQPLPIYLQDHGNPVMFRNVWMVMGTSGDAEPKWVCQPPARRVGPLRRWLRGLR
jgi:hypothetical protein